MGISQYGSYISLALIVAVLITNLLSLLVSFRYRMPTWAAALIMVALAVWSAIAMRNVTLPWPMPEPLQWVQFALLITIAKGSVALKGYFHCMICIQPMMLRIAASFVAEPVFGYGTDAYYTAWAALTVALLAGYTLFIRRYGVTWRDTLEGSVSTPVLTLFALVALVCWQSLKALYIVPGMLGPVVPMKAEIGFLLFPFLSAGLALALGISYLFAQHRAADQLEIRLAQSALSAGHSHYQAMAELNTSISAMRHDYRHHMASLQALLGAGNVDEARRYLDQMQARGAAMTLHSYCQSQVINALLNSFAARCAQDSIDFGVQINLPDSEVHAEYELCIILGNLLENAVSACSTLKPDERKFIDLVIRPQDTQYGIRVKNSFDDHINEDARGLLSRKPEAGGQPGLGIQSIKAIAKRHGGSYYPKWKNGVFTAYVVLRRSNVA